MSAQNQDDDQVVMGYPVDYFQRQAEPEPRHDEGQDIITIPPSPCENHASKKCLCLTCFLVSFLLTAVLLLFLILGYYFTCDNNKSPDIKIESVTASEILAFPNNTVWANWHLTIYFHNPNTFASISYTNIQVSASSDDERTFWGSVDSFDQKKGVERRNVGIFGLWMDMEKEKLMTDAGEMVVSLRINGEIRLENLFKNHKWQKLDAYCGSVFVKPSMTLWWDGSAGCNIDIDLIH
ncbi:hypothetical protein CCACVL1_29572 [Corchorus capsularis]|uniref:Late embryogenesis abundant protein, LEA-14 n=1 Tax=Corchorus capsularis TaxID=210143 RepID=A0A1R3G149_COCAP|nr:hypothetical protein CCACVL1_29572 [Corchorus capsularis]